MRDIRPPGLEEALSAPRRGFDAEEAVRPIPAALLPRFDAPALFPPAMGLLTGKRGFGARVWESRRSTPPFDAGAALRRLSLRAGSPALARLARRLLLTTAPAPAGVSSEAFGLLRLELLYALGDLEAMERLRARWPVLDMLPLARRLRIEVALASAAPARACALYRAHADAGGLDRGSDAFSTRMDVFCAVFSGEAQKALFKGEILREQRGDADGFLARVKAALGAFDAPAEDVAAPLDPVAFGLLRLAGRAPSARALRSAPPALLVALASDADMPVETRRMVGARAVARGIFPPRAARALYAAPADAADRLTSVFATALPPDAYLGALIVHAPDFRALVPRETPPALARHALRAFLLLDSRAQIARWRGVLEARMPAARVRSTKDVREGALRLLVADALNLKGAARQRATASTRARLASLRGRILDVLFRPLPPARAEGRGEAVLRALRVLGARGLDRVRARDMEARLAALVRVGLGETARAIGVEAFIMAMHAIETRAGDYTR